MLTKKKHFFSPEPLDNFYHSWHKASLCEVDSSLFAEMERYIPIVNDDNIAKNKNWGIQKNLPTRWNSFFKKRVKADKNGLKVV